MQGTVNKINYNGRAYNAEIGGVWYGLGFNEPAFKQGDVLEFEFEQSGKFKNLKPNPKVLGNASSGSVSAPAQAPSNSYKDRDVSIAYQSSRKDALALVGILVQSGAVALPTKKSDQADAVLGLVDYYTNLFFVKIDDTVKAGGVTVEELVPTE